MSSNFTADLILRNARIARIARLNPAAPWADTLAVKDGRGLAVGALADIHDAHHGAFTAVRDMAGALIMPGLHDAHNHHQLGGKADLMEVTFLPTASLDDIIETVRTYARDLGPDARVVGRHLRAQHQDSASLRRDRFSGRGGVT